VESSPQAVRHEQAGFDDARAGGTRDVDVAEVCKGWGDDVGRSRRRRRRRRRNGRRRRGW
jgi:hypothetical protein